MCFFVNQKYGKMLNVVMLIVVMLNVVMLIVARPFLQLLIFYGWGRHSGGEIIVFNLTFRS